MIRIEILEIVKGQLRMAFYYPVPNNIYSPSSEDQTRLPSGGKLTVQEKQLLKDGKLIEHLITHQINGNPVSVIKGQLEGLWNSTKQKVKDKYVDDFNYSGITWNGSIWN